MIAQVPLIHAIGARRVMENIGSGEPFTAQRAYEVGLLQSLSSNPVEAARNWLTAASRAGAVMAHRASVYQFAEMGYSDALAEAQRRFAGQFEQSPA
jgi:enoyl-CoA hydratase/carnithine racemase